MVGSAVGRQAGAILTSIDSFKIGPSDLPAGAVCYPGTPGAGVPPSACSAKLPRTGLFCCSGYGPEPVPNLKEYDFALKFAALRPLINETRALATFDLWSGLLTYHRSIALHQRAAFVLAFSLFLFVIVSDRF